MSELGSMNPDESLVMVSAEEIAVKDFKSVFYQMTAKPDNTTKVFQKEVVLDLEDIFILNERVTDKLTSHYNDAGFLISTNVKFSNGKIKSFSSWRDFESHKWYESESISSIVILWEFNAMLPQYNVPQKHTLTVKMTNSMRPEELLNIIFTGNLDELEELDKNFFPIVARVDFIDRVLGDELLNLVTDWVKGLKDSAVQKSKFMIFLKRNKGKLSSLLNFVTYIVIAISSVVLVNSYIKSLNIIKFGDITSYQLRCILNVIFLCAGVWILAKKLVSIITDQFFTLLRDYGDNFLFNITKGDINKQEKMQKREKQSRISIMINLIGTIILNIICSVIANKVF